MKQLFLGTDNDKKRVHIDEETRSWHMHILGAPGGGKSKFMEWMIRGDIRAGNGLCLIDPHGSLYRDVLKWCAYNNFLSSREIILVDPSSDFVTGFNPFSREEGSISSQVDDRIDVMCRAWGAENTDQTPTLERWLSCIFWTIIEKNLSLAEARFLIDFDRLDLIENLTADLSEPSIVNQWKLVINELRYARDYFRASKDIRNDMQSTYNRLARFLRAGHLMNFFGQLEQKLDLLEIMESGKILLVNLQPSGDFSLLNTRIFGSLLVKQFLNIARRRKRPDDVSYPKPFYLYVDEFHRYATSDFEDILGDCRKMGLHLIFAHQALGQLKKNNLDPDTVLQTAGTKVVFGCRGRNDAKTMVENMFVNQLDMEEIKQAAASTKFWPVYIRDEVRTKAKSTTIGGSHGAGESSTHGLGSVSGTGHIRPEGLFEGTGSFSDFSSLSMIDTHSDSSFDSDSWSDTEMEAVADIPLLYPVPFKESTQVYSLEDQIFKMSDALMSQWSRHCFIKIGNEKTIPMLVPKVREPKVFDSRLEEYQQKLMERSPYSLPVTKARGLIEQRQRRLLKSAKPLSEPEPGEGGWGVDTED